MQRFWEFMVRWAVYVAIFIPVLIIGLAVLTLLISPVPDIDDPVKGTEARGTPIKAAEVSFRNLLIHDDFTTTPDVDIDLDLYLAHPVFTYLMDTFDCDDGDCLAEEPSFSTCDNLASSDKFQLTFGSGTDSNLYTVEAMHALCEWTAGVEQLTTVNPDCPVHTLAGHVSLISGVECSHLTSAHLDSVHRLLTTCAPYINDGSLTPECFVTQCPDVPVDCTRTPSVHHILVYLTDKDFAGGSILTYTQVFVPLLNDTLERAEEFYNQFERNYDNNHLRLVGADVKIKESLYRLYVKEDFLFISFGLGIVLVLTLIYTHSVIITISLVMDIILSYAFAYFFYYIVFRISFFPFLNLLAALLIVAIAADDIFLFYDILQQHRQEHPGLDMATLLNMTAKHAVKSVFTTSFTTATALYATTVSNITIVKCFAVFSGTAVICNFIVLMTFVPAMIVLQDKLSKKVNLKPPPPRLANVINSVKKTGGRLFHQLIPWLVNNLYPLWIILFTLIAVGAFVVVYYKPKFELQQDGTLQLLNINEITEYYDQNLAEYFLYEQQVTDRAGLPVHFIWGVIPDDNGNPFEPDDTGVLKMKSDFDMSSPEVQEIMASFCLQIRTANFTHEITEQQPCTMESFNTFMSFPCVGSLLQPCCGRQGQAPFPSDVFRECFPMFIIALSASVNMTYFLGTPYFDDQANVVAYSVSCLSTQPFVLQHDPMREFYEEITSFTESINQLAPGESTRMFSTTFLTFYDLQLSLPSGTYESFYISLGMALVVVLITTRNVVATVLSMATITFAIFVTLAVLTLDGWKLNIFESLVLSLAIGLSVDFTIHYSIGYLIATENVTRQEKISRLMFRLGSSVAMAALTTFSAAIPVVWSRVRGYQQLAQFLLVIMSCSWSFATLYLLSLYRVIGPRGKQGYIPWPQHWNRCCKSSVDPNFPGKSPSHGDSPIREHMSRSPWYTAGNMQQDLTWQDAHTNNHFYKYADHRSNVNRLPGVPPLEYYNEHKYRAPSHNRLHNGSPPAQGAFHPIPAYYNQYHNSMYHSPPPHHWRQSQAVQTYYHPRNDFAHINSYPISHLQRHYHT